jgi:hypothetical protein
MSTPLFCFSMGWFDTPVREQAAVAASVDEARAASRNPRDPVQLAFERTLCAAISAPPWC